MSFWENMNTRKNSTLLVISAAVVFIGIILYTNASRNPGAYESKVQKSRDARHLYLKNSPESPIPRELKPEFEGLAYFPINAKFLSPADLDRDPQPDTVRMLLSNGQAERMVKVGTINFTLNKTPQKLSAFRPVDGKAGSDLFVPFTDLTTGNQTYGGGRYVNVPTNGPGLAIDFNNAYHPDCLYNDGFACPIPPSENRLDLEITAGEKLPEGLGELGSVRGK